MGILACNRKGCENIMCDTYISNYGYLCYDCLSEYESILEYKKPTTKKKAYKLLDKFINSEKIEVNESEVIKIQDIINKI